MTSSKLAHVLALIDKLPPEDQYQLAQLQAAKLARWGRSAQVFHRNRMIDDLISRGMPWATLEDWRQIGELLKSQGMPSRGPYISPRMLRASYLGWRKGRGLA